MKYAKWTFRIVLVTLIFGFFHYTLPQKDIVRIVNTYEERQDLGDWTRIFWSNPDDQSTSLSNRDVQFIQAVQANGDTMVYRNEDTGWSWPPYFKFDTANLYTEANDAVSAKANPEWYAITHYGWRNEFLSIFPNAVGLKPVVGPDARFIPWFNIVFFAALAILLLLIRSMWRQFRERSIDPVLEDIGDAGDAARDQAQGVWGRFSRWLATWRGRS